METTTREEWVHVRAYKHGQADALKALLYHFGNELSKKLTQYINVEIEAREDEAKRAEKELTR